MNQKLYQDPHYDPLFYTAKVYHKALPDLDEDSIHPEFHTFTTVWLRINMPAIYNELKKSFRRDEAEIYAHAQTPTQGELF
jgi:hypothetical protein